MGIHAKSATRRLQTMSKAGDCVFQWWPCRIVGTERCMACGLLASEHDLSLMGGRRRRAKVRREAAARQGGSGAAVSDATSGGDTHASAIGALNKPRESSDSRQPLSESGDPVCPRCGDDDACGVLQDDGTPTSFVTCCICGEVYQNPIADAASAQREQP